MVQDIEQTWRRRVLFNIQSGVRVKMPPKHSIYVRSDQRYSTNHMQSMLKHLQIESERSKLSQKSSNHSKREHYLISTGIQTIIIPKIDQQISCNIMKSTRQNRKYQSSSSETSSSNEYSNQTDDISNETSIASNNDHKRRYHRNTNANINSMKAKEKHIDIEQFNIDKDNERTADNTSKNDQCYSQSILSGRKAFFHPLLKLFSIFRSSTFKRDRICLSTNNSAIPLTSSDHHTVSKNTIQTPKSRCRRSNENYIQKQFDKISHLEQKTSQPAISYKSPSIQEQDTQTKNDSHIHHRKTRLHRSQEKKHRKLSELSISCEDQSKVLAQKNSKSSIGNINDWDKISYPSHKKSEQFIKKSLTRNTIFSPKNVSSPLRSNQKYSTLPLSTKQNVCGANAIHLYVRNNLVNEYKSHLSRTRNLHFNNNSLDDNDDLKMNTWREKRIVKTRKNSRVSIVSSDSQSISTDNSSKNIHRLFQGQNEIIREGIDQLLRYQNFAKSYQLQSNKVVHEFLMKSNILSTKSLHKLSIENEPHQNHKLN